MICAYCDRPVAPLSQCKRCGARSPAPSWFTKERFVEAAIFHRRSQDRWSPWPLSDGPVTWMGLPVPADWLDAFLAAWTAL